MTTTQPHLRAASELGIGSVRDVVERVFHVEGTLRGDELDMLCPDPAHQDRNPSASVNLTSGYWHCFSCGVGGDIIGLGVRLLGKDRDEIEEMLVTRSPQALLAILGSIEARNSRKKTTVALDVPMPSDYAPGPLTELRARGFHHETLRRWEVRYVASQRMEGQNRPFTIYASIGIPIIDQHQRVLAWCYRRTESSPGWQPRYLYTGGASLVRDVWFGAQHHERVRDIVVVEGALDAMWCDQAGIPAVALLGSSMGSAGSRKLAWLGRFRSVTLLGDFDAAGAQAVRRIGKATNHLTHVRVARYSSWMGAKDPQELSPIDLELVVERAMPWSEFVISAGR